MKSYERIIKGVEQRYQDSVDARHLMVEYN